MSSYATPSDLTKLGIAASALVDVDLASRQAALDAASNLADGYLSAEFELPLTAWGSDLTEAVSKIAAYNLLRTRGYNPEAGSDPTIRDGYMDAVRWLERVSDGKITPQVTDSQSGGTVAEHGGPFVVQPVFDHGLEAVVISAPKARGW